jgi:single-strand DNA-binding protein
MAEVKLAEVNKVLLSGRLTRDPELRYTPNGNAVSSFSLASDRRYKGQDGEWKKVPTFVKVNCWGKLGVLVNEYLKKGSAALVEGRLETRNWETDDGQKRSVIEITADHVQFLDKVSRTSAAEGGADEQPAEPAEGAPAVESDEDVPF